MLKKEQGQDNYFNQQSLLLKSKHIGADASVVSSSYHQG